MYLGMVILGLVSMFFLLWGDFMKLLIFLEVVSMIFIIMVLWGFKMDLFSMNFFFSSMIFLVCESSMGFLLFIFYISMENEVVKKLNLIQF